MFDLSSEEKLAAPRQMSLTDLTSCSTFGNKGLPQNNIYHE